MGHLLSKNGNRGNRLKKRKRKLLKRKKRNCFLQGPCMLCFIVHGNSGSLGSGGGVGGGEDEDGQRSEVVSGCGSERLAALSSPDDCAKFLLSPRELAIWEGLSAVPARLVVPRALFRATPPCEYAEMVCKRKCADVRRCAPCKQPRCCARQEPIENGGGAGPGGGGARDGAAAAHRQLPLCPLPSSSSSSTSSTSSSSSEGVSGAGPQTDSGEIPGSTGSTAAATPRSSSPSCHQDHAYGDAQPGESAADNSSINHLPSSILLKVRGRGLARGQSGKCSFALR